MPIWAVHQRHAQLEPAWRRSTWWLVVREMRPRQWSKNLLVFLAPAAASVLGHGSTAWRVIGAFAVFCAVASGHYLINDVVDAEQDRHHPIKQRRPVASGDLAPSVALGAGIGLITLGLAGAALLGPWPFVVVVASYLALSVAYSLWIKRQPVMELAVVAAGFV
jgi:decaprenyl-phosphate phosphoribosyltransferase